MGPSELPVRIAGNRGSRGLSARHRFRATRWVARLLCCLLSVSIPEVGATEASVNASPLQIPKSVRAEHEEIHSMLVEATKAPGRVGVTAKELADVLHPHFVREEQIALPPLGVLAPLLAGDQMPANVVSEALTMTDTLRSELPNMLDEHKAIRDAVEKLRLAARAEHATKYEHLAEQLAVHAQTEEEVLYRGRPRG